MERALVQMVSDSFAGISCEHGISEWNRLNTVIVSCNKSVFDIIMYSVVITTIAKALL